MEWNNICLDQLFRQYGYFGDDSVVVDHHTVYHVANLLD